MLAVRAADPSAEIALTWTTLAPPRPALLAAVRPRWLNYRFGLVDPRPRGPRPPGRPPASVWTPDTRRSMRRLMDMGVDSITTNRVDTLCALRQPLSKGHGNAPRARATERSTATPAAAAPRIPGAPGSRRPTPYTSDRCATVAGSSGFARVTYCGTGAESSPVSRTRP